MEPKRIAADQIQFGDAETRAELDAMIARAREALAEFESAVRSAECAADRGTSSEAAEEEKRVDAAREKLLAYLTRPILITGYLS